MGRPAGFKLSDETRRKMSEARKKMIASAEAEQQKEFDLEEYHRGVRTANNSLPTTVTVRLSEPIMRLLSDEAAPTSGTSQVRAIGNTGRSVTTSCEGAAIY